MIGIQKMDKVLAESLAKRFFEGDKNVAEDLYLLYKPMIEACSVKLAYKYSTYNIESEEVFARLNLKFYESLLMWNPKKGASFYSYWFASQRSECGNYLREIIKDRNEVVPLIDQIDSIKTSMDDHTRKNDQVALVAQMLLASGKSEKKYRAICNAIYESDEELSYTEIGILVGESKQTVSNRLKKFRDIFYAMNLGDKYDYVTVA